MTMEGDRPRVKAVSVAPHLLAWLEVFWTFCTLSPEQKCDDTGSFVELLTRTWASAGRHHLSWTGGQLSHPPHTMGSCQKPWDGLWGGVRGNEGSVGLAKVQGHSVSSFMCGNKARSDPGQGQGGQGDAGLGRQSSAAA